jgi:23S rRNA pseudouridine1911/1915/1917 synthase
MALVKIAHQVVLSEVGRIDRVVQALTNFSRAQIRGMFEQGCVSLDGKACLDPGLCVEVNTLVSVEYDPHRRYKERAQYQSRIFQIIHEDPYLLVVEKSAGVLTVPTLRNEKENLLEALNVYLRRGRSKGIHAEVVHRLDRDTSGLLVFAKNVSVAQKLKSQFEMHKPLREYIAIVAGTLSKTQGTFRSFLATDEDLNQRSVPSPQDGVVDKTKGALAITHYEVIDVLRDTTHVKVTLETGKRNQIRVHFSEIGHPVLGDARYEPKLARHPSWKHHRLALHAAKLGFTHPITGKNLCFESTAGTEFDQFLREQRRR